jgi:hypothetical protein
MRVLRSRGVPSRGRRACKAATDDVGRTMVQTTRHRLGSHVLSDRMKWGPLVPTTDRSKNPRRDAFTRNLTASTALQKRRLLPPPPPTLCASIPPASAPVVRMVLTLDAVTLSPLLPLPPLPPRAALNRRDGTSGLVFDVWNVCVMLESASPPVRRHRQCSGQTRPKNRFPW